MIGCTRNNRNAEKNGGGVKNHKVWRAKSRDSAARRCAPSSHVRPAVWKGERRSGSRPCPCFCISTNGVARMSEGIAEPLPTSSRSRPSTGLLPIHMQHGAEKVSPGIVMRSWPSVITRAHVRQVIEMHDAALVDCLERAHHRVQVADSLSISASSCDDGLHLAVHRRDQVLRGHSLDRMYIETRLGPVSAKIARCRFSCVRYRLPI